LQFHSWAKTKESWEKEWIREEVEEEHREEEKLKRGK
jgi:hypothetical protein